MRTRAATVLLGALVLARCGSDDRPETARGGGGELTAREMEFDIDPAKARVATDGSISIKVRNAGRAVHALALETGGEASSTGTIDPGRTATLTADLEPGRYTWYCPVGNHRQLGMTGTLTVGKARGSETKPSAPASPGGGYGY